MPELPEVENICRSAQKSIIGKKIFLIKTSKKSLRLPLPNNLSNLENQTILNVSRRARYIFIKTTNKKILLVHFGMSGKLIYLEKLPKKFHQHDHFIIYFSDKSCLIYNDPRRFGLIDLVDEQKIEQHKMLKNLGLEPLEKDFNPEYLQKKLKNKKINIKTAMMDNKIVVGVGNIYINESLFISKISPLTPSHNLGLQKLKILVRNIKLILQKAIDLGGSSINDYVNSNGDSGSFQLGFKVYGKENKDCLVCCGKIKRIKQNGRSSFYCPNCQK